MHNGISSNSPMAVPKVAVPRTLDGGDYRFFYWCRHYLGDALLTANEWEVAVMQDVYAGSVKFGNHICLPQVCWKGRFKKIHFCRMLYWHWRRSINAKGAEVMKRAHGLLLQRAWGGTGFPPVQQALPNPGTPLLEINFPFFFKLTPAVLLGPRCNHDLGVLLRLPVLPEKLMTVLLQPRHRSGEPRKPDVHDRMEATCEEVLNRITGWSHASVLQNRAFQEGQGKVSGRKPCGDRANSSEQNVSFRDGAFCGSDALRSSHGDDVGMGASILGVGSMEGGGVASAATQRPALETAQDGDFARDGSMVRDL